MQNTTRNIKKIEKKNHDEVSEDTWKNLSDEWLDYVKSDVFCTNFGYARHSKGTEKITEFAMEKCLTLPLLGWKYFIGLLDECDELIHL